MHVSKLPAADPGAASPWRFCVAPMMDWTDRHCRVFHRLLAPDARLYTEMRVDQALLRGDRERLLGFDPSEHPVALQLGGSEPSQLAAAARIAAEFGYDEINLNVGCPSDRVQSGRFGACLMKEPERVGDCVAAMRAAVAVPVTVKCRLGVDEMDDDEHLHRFVDRVVAAGCRVLIVHARKAWLSGLNPRQNREIPPLEYPRVFALKRRYPALTVVLNGGLADVRACEQALTQVDGVMLGRAAYQQPELLGLLQARWHGRPGLSGAALVDALEHYLHARAIPVRCLTRHLHGLFQGSRGARRWRQTLAAGASPATAYEALRDAPAHAA